MKTVTVIISLLFMIAGSAVSDNFSIEFDGHEDWIEVSDFTNENLDVYTVEGWFYPHTEPGYWWDGLISQTECGFSVFVFHENLLASYTDCADKLSSTPAPPFLWHHFAAVFDGVSQKLYLDGEEVLDSPTSVPNVGTDVYIGTDYFGMLTNEFDGIMDEIRVSNSVRYTDNFTPKTRFALDETTVALWHFDEGSGDIAFDSSPNGNDGTILNATWSSETPAGNVIRIPNDYPTIQDGIDAAADRDTVLVADGTYSGEGNKNVDFLGKKIKVVSTNGPEYSVIDCEGDGRGFYFHSNENESSILEGFSIIHGNVTGYDPSGSGGGIFCDENSSPQVINCIIRDNSAMEWGGGGISCYLSSPLFQSCIIRNNVASVGGGIKVSDASPFFSECVIQENTVLGGQGGGLFIARSPVTMTNCIVSQNTSASGAGVYCAESSPSIINCTISGNTAAEFGGGFYFTLDASPIITNCILWNDLPEEIFVNSGLPTVTFSDVQDTLWPGEGNISDDPLFLGVDDYHLTRESPCIDSGTSEGAPNHDIDGDIRPMGNGFEMGSDEFIPNRPPHDFSLLLPVDEDTTWNVSVAFDWEDASDPDLDDVFYNLYLDTDSTFTNPDSICGLSESEYTHLDTLINFSQYFWKVAASDTISGQTWSREMFSFYTFYEEAVCEIEPPAIDVSVLMYDVKTETLFISNQGNADLSFIIDWSQSWLTPYPETGLIQPGSTESVLVEFDSGMLLPGSYTDSLVVTTNALYDPVQIIPVTLLVESPILTILECEYPIAPRRGFLEFQAGLSNQTTDFQYVDAWLDLYLINGSPYPDNPLQGPIGITMGPLYEGIQDRRLYVPNYTPLGGPYKLYLRCGEYPDIWNESYFEFTVAPARED